MENPTGIIECNENRAHNGTHIAVTSRSAGRRREPNNTKRNAEWQRELLKREEDRGSSMRSKEVEKKSSITARNTVVNKEIQHGLVLVYLFSNL